MLSAKKLAEIKGCICGICKNPVDLSIRYPHPASPSVDHIIPRIGGGLSTIDNLQLAHFSCNSRKTFLIAPRGYKPPIVEDAVAYAIAENKFRKGLKERSSSGGLAGGSKGGKRVHEVHPNLAKDWGSNIPREAKSRGGRATNASTNGRKGNGGRANGAFNCHNRWHVLRNVKKFDCKFCMITTAPNQADSVSESINFTAVLTA